MPYDPFISEVMWNRIDRELGAIEQEDNVRILLAVESGSRAWRFPSPDSDYDVRFIYVRPIDSYLSIEPPRDVIERPSDGVLDINGWDLRKALQLLVRSNAVLVEWLTSPVRYRDAGAPAKRMHDLTRETCYLPAVAYHYDRLARRSLDDILSFNGPVRLKTYCYALRPVLALMWTRRHGEPPPMDMSSLLEGIVIGDAVRQAIVALVERKAAATEQDMTLRIPELDGLIAESLAQPVDRFILPDRTSVLAQANALFAAILRDDAA
jgi:uncharacterized protein